MDGTLRKRAIASISTLAEESESGAVGSTIKKLDIFPKVMPSYKETSSSGGTTTVITFVFIFFLVMSELASYRTQNITFKYGVDPEVDGKLELNFDIAVAMDCAYISADILESTGDSMEGAEHHGRDDGKNDHGHNEIREHPIVYELSESQREWWSNRFQHPIDEFLSLAEFKQKTKEKIASMPVSLTHKAKNGCNLQGSLKINKVAGNFHILAGQGVNTPMGHSHNVLRVPHTAFNFSHRITHLSFGDEMPGMTFPMDGDEETATSNNFMFQYFIQVVPTVYLINGESIRTAQFSVTRQSRDLISKPGTYRHPGIFFKYEISPILVTVKYENSSIWLFLVRLCGIIGGVFVTSGVIHNLVAAFYDYLKKRTFIKSNNNGAIVQ